MYGFFNKNSSKKSFSRLVIFTLLLFFTTITLFGTFARAEIQPFKMPYRLELCGERIEMTSDLHERLEVRYYAYQRSTAQMLLWMKRTKRFFPVIEEMLAENGLPDDLKYIPVVESALIQKSYSKKGAVGVWQFMRHTGKRFGLKISRNKYDERRDVYKATEAAVRYWKFLYEKFGSWPLAMAAYNIGENRVAREVREQGTDNFFEMTFPRETDEYVINVLIVKHIMERPLKYGLEIDDDEYFKPFYFSEVKIKVDGYRKPLSVVSKAAGATMREIKNLNPQIIGNFLFSGTHIVRIPPDGEPGFNKRYARLLKDYEASNDTYVKVVKPKAALREGPGTEFKRYKMVKRGSRFKFLSKSNSLYLKRPWYEIEVRNKSYWVWSGLATIVD